VKQENSKVDYYSQIAKDPIHSAALKIINGN